MNPEVIIGLAVVPQKTAVITKVISNEPGRCVIVEFSDGGKEVVHCAKEDVFDVYVGTAIAVAKHSYKTTSRFHKTVDAVLTTLKAKEKKKESR